MTTPLEVSADLDRAPWSDLGARTVTHGMVQRIGLLPNGTQNGRASVALVIRTDDGRIVVAETTWRLFNVAARALAASPVAAAEPDDP